MMTLTDVNKLSDEEFVTQFGAVAEHSPFVARHAASLRPFSDVAALQAAFRDAVLAASPEAQMALLRAHPDLAGKAKLTCCSAEEQAGAGLDQLTEDEFEQFTHLNELYKARFDFPFILAVKGASKEQILASFRERVNNEPEQEFQTALAQIFRIFQFRLESLVRA